MIVSFILTTTLIQIAYLSSASATITGFSTIGSGTIEAISDLKLPNTTRSNPYKTDLPAYPPYYCQITVNFNLTFTHTPKILFGILSLTFDARSQNAYRQFALMNMQSSSTSFVLGIFMSKINIIAALKLNYIAFDTVVHTELSGNPGTLNQTSLVALAGQQGLRQTSFSMTISNGPLKQGNQYGLLAWLIGFSMSATQSFNIGFKLSYSTDTNYNIKVSLDDDTSLKFIQWNRLFFDTTQIEKSQINFVDYGWVDGSQGKQSSESTLPYYIESTYLVGATAIKMSLVQGNDFTMARSNTSTFSTGAGYTYLNFTYFNYRRRICPDGYPKYSDSLKMCYDQCPVNKTFLDTSVNENGLCIDCNANCLTCSDVSTCGSCDQSLHHAMNEGSLCQCDSNNGYLNQTQTGLCKLCSELMLGCLECTYQQSTICSSCFTPNYTLVKTRSTGVCQCQSPFVVVDESSCVNCLDILPGCLSCTTNMCDACDSTVFLTAVDGHCVCSEGYYCVSGTDSSCYVCKLCSVQFNRQFVEGVCQCIEGYAECTTEGCDTSLCHYKANDLNYSVSVIKDSQSNTLIYQLTFNQIQSEFQNIDWFKVISLGLPNSTNYSYSYKDGKVTIFAHYNQNLQGTTTNITVDLSQSDSSFYSEVEPTTQTFVIQPTNNLSADFYDEDTYKGNQILTYLAYTSLVLGFLTFFLGMYSSKVVVTQMIGVLQLSYVCLLLLDYGDPLVNSLLNLRFFYGADTLIFGRSSISSVKLNSLYYNSLLINNLNIDFAFLCVPIVLGFVFFLVTIPKTKLQKRFQGYYRIMIGQYLLIAIQFILYNFMISLIVFMKYNSQLVKTSIWFYLSSVQIVLFGLVFIWSCVYFLLKDFQYFGQFKYLFKVKQGCYYFIPTLQRVAIGIIFMLGNSTFISAAVAMGIIIIGAVYVAVLKPFTDNKHNYRSIFNSFCSFAIITIMMIIKLNQESRGQSVYTKLPYGVIGIILVVVIVSLSFVIKKFVETKLNKLKERKYLQADSKQKDNSNNVDDDFQKRMLEIIKNPKTNQITKKLLSGKIRKSNKPKQRPKVESINPSQQNCFRETIAVPAEQLSPQKFEKVNEMLREGLI